MAQDKSKIDCYVDCVSPYSWFAYIHLTSNREALAKQNVEVEFHPFFLGGVMQGTGNKPPGTLPARQTHQTHDRHRAMQHYSLSQMQLPTHFPINTLPYSRCLCAIKTSHPQTTFEKALHEGFRSVWELKEDLAEPDTLRSVLGRVFPNDEEHVQRILDRGVGAGNGEAKETLTTNTRTAISQGAYGAPWMWVRNAGTGVEEPFFGSDRWGYMWRFLGLRFRELALEGMEGRGEVGEGAKL